MRLRRRATRSARPRTVWHWRCKCGAHDRGGSWNEADVHFLANDHRLRRARCEPEVYSSDGTPTSLILDVNGLRRA